MSDSDYKDESAFIQRLKKGEPKSMEELYERYSAALYGVIICVVGKEELAEDVLQESFVKIWKNLPKYDASKGRLYTWMLNVARNNAIDKLRSKAYKTSEKNQSLETTVHLTNSKNTPNINTIGVKELVAKLKPEQQKIIDLVYFKGYTQNEVSESLDIPLGTVKSRIRIAMRELKKVFN